MHSNKIPIGIKTCVKNQNRQKTVRDTWLQDIDTDKFFPIFLLGRPNAPTILIKDILYLDCDDSYPLLYTKTLAYFDWTYHNTIASHFWIVDDDSYINAKLFNSYNKYLNYDYSGSFIYGMEKVNDNSGFTSGSGYCLSREATRVLLDCVSKEIDRTNTENKKFCEDVLVGDTLSMYMPNIKKLHIKNIYPWSYCQFYKNLMIGHYIHINSGLSFEDSMKKMHSLYQENHS